MVQFHCLNPIAACGLELFPDTYEKTDDFNAAEVALVRSAAMHDMELPKPLLAVARAGAGVNNIPLDKCAEQGIVVFNTPGANANGVKELIVIAQDTTRYGEDIYGKLMLPELLRRLCKIEGVHWIRLLYCYPNRITDELIDVIATEDKILKYIDLPLQHSVGRVLSEMNRGEDTESLTALIQKLRDRIPNMVIRTTFIAGFPGETEEEFNQMAEFSRNIRFDRMGCFAYSQEEDTPAALMPNQIDEDVKQHRAQIMMEEQMDIMQQLGQQRIGTIMEILVEGYDEYSGCYYGRSYADSPDIDGKVLFTAVNTLPTPGDFVHVHITDCINCDLMGELVEGGHTS